MKQQLTLMLLAFTLLATAHPDPGSPARDYDNYHLGASRKNIIVMPDAAGKSIQLLFVAGRTAPATVKVTDSQGKLVLVQESMLEQGKNKISLLNFMQLPEGEYTIRLLTANKAYSTSFVFWK
jgi:hypothetical protein